MKWPTKFSSLAAVVGVTAVTLTFAAHAADDNASQGQLAVSPPAFLQLEITSACTDGGAIFKVINRGRKWPRTGFLRLYYADTKTLISERRLRLGEGQKVSFVVKPQVADGRPVGIWIEPEWYKRDFEYDARITC